MAHPLLTYSPFDLRLQASWACRLATTVAPGHGRPMENSASSAAHPETLGRATCEDQRSCNRFGSCDRGHPLPLPARIRMPGAWDFAAERGWTVVRRSVGTPRCHR